MYPQINEFVTLLHEKKISSFLVTNAQFPKEMKNLVPVTQLYVSIDAPTEETLKQVDRPLFKDFWSRYEECLDILAEKKQRTVFRLTLVKDFNTQQVQDYCKLVEKGKPDFIEVKGMTFCGFSGSQPLTMKNVPYHQDVVAFCQEIEAELFRLSLPYEISCIHSHTCSVLLSHLKFKKDDGWYTWIDYEKFHNLVATGMIKNAGCEEYMAKTPEWAVAGAEEEGFDPNEVRHYRQKVKNMNK